MPQNTLAADGTLSSCSDVFEFPPQKIKRKGGWEPCFEIGTYILGYLINLIKVDY